MYNWSTDTTELQKHPEQYTVWKLEQLLNYGLNGNKIPEKELKKYLNLLNIDPNTRRFLKLLLYENIDTY